MSELFGFDYPAGVTGNEAAIIGAETIKMNVTCGEDEVQVVPSWAAKEELLCIQLEVSRILNLTTSRALLAVDEMRHQITESLERMYKLEDVGSWECTFTGDVDVTVISKDQGSWDCPDCGTVHDDLDISPDDSDEWDR